MIESPQRAGRFTSVQDPDVVRLLHGRLHDPRRVLGLHFVGDRDAIVRVLLPNAARVQVPTADAELERVPNTALFEWMGPRDKLAAPYRVRWQDFDGIWHERWE